MRTCQARHIQSMPCDPSFGQQSSTQGQLQHISRSAQVRACPAGAAVSSGKEMSGIRPARIWAIVRKIATPTVTMRVDMIEGNDGLGQQ